MKQLKTASDKLLSGNQGWIALVVFLTSVSDASFIPLPAQTFFLLVAIIYPNLALRITVLATAGTVTGALVAYYTGHLLFFGHDGQLSSAGNFLIGHIPGFSSGTYLKIMTLYSEWGMWILFAASFIAIPFGFFAISAGIFNFNPVIYIGAVLLSQLIKYFLLAFLVARFGKRIRTFLDSRIKPVAFITILTILLAFIISCN